jgi:AraC family transcriptional regulator
MDDGLVLGEYDAEEVHKHSAWSIQREGIAMDLHIPATRPVLQYGAAPWANWAFSAGQLETRAGVSEEETWRRPVMPDNASIATDILVSRWTDPSHSARREEVVSASDRHIFSVALKTTRLKLTSDSRILFDGAMAAGTLHIAGPSQTLAAVFYAPCDFVHFHVLNSYLSRCRVAAHSELPRAMPDLNDLVIRDPLAEQLGRVLIEKGNSRDELFANSVGQTLVMHVSRLEVPGPRVSALPKWRLKRVHEYVDAHLESTISLSDMAAVAGLSRMHFAAQFRTATGFRPHDYLLNQRIERAKALLSKTNTPLAEVALIVGFHAQAHFSTVFKRYTGETPACWRRNNEHLLVS